MMHISLVGISRYAEVVPTTSIIVLVVSDKDKVKKVICDTVLQLITASELHV